MLPPSFKGEVSIICGIFYDILTNSFGAHCLVCIIYVFDLISQHYMDGGFSSMQPVLPPLCSHTLTVSPFSGETDICPPDTPCMWDVVVSGTTFKGNMANSKRVINALYPLALEVSPCCMPNSPCADIYTQRKNGIT